MVLPSFPHPSPKLRPVLCDPARVPDDDPIPGLTTDLALPAPFPPDDTTTQWGSATAPSWTPSVQEWTDYSPGPWPAATAAKIEIDGRDEDGEANWWDPATRRKHRRPGPGILPPLLADRLHNSEHSLFSVTVTPPDIKQPPPHHPTSPTHPASSPTPSSSSSSSASSTAPQPTPEEVRTAVPHPNAYYCRRHNGWVLLLWKSSSVVPPLARSFKRAHKHDPDDYQHADKSAHAHVHPPLPDQARRRKTPSCLGAVRDQPFGQTNRTHHFHLYERAVDARMLTPAFHRSEWEAAVLDKRKRRKLTLRGDDIDTAALAQALDAGAPTAAMEHDADGEDDADAADEGDLLDLYVCCQCSFYCVASEVVPGVVPARYVEDFVKLKTEHPPPGKSKEVSLMMAWETILTYVTRVVDARAARADASVCAASWRTGSGRTRAASCPSPARPSRPRWAGPRPCEWPLPSHARTGRTLSAELARTGRKYSRRWGSRRAASSITRTTRTRSRCTRRASTPAPRRGGATARSCSARGSS